MIEFLGRRFDSVDAAADFAALLAIANIGGLRVPPTGRLLAAALTIARPKGVWAWRWRRAVAKALERRIEQYFG